MNVTFLLLIIASLFVVGCEPTNIPKNDLPSMSYGPYDLQTNARHIAEVEKRSGLRFSPNTEILSQSMISEADITQYTWTLYSKEEIVMPISTKYGRDGFMIMDISTATQILKSRIGTRMISVVNKAILSRWNIDNQEIKGRLLKTNDGYYLMIDYFVDAK
jgi:hypothetical protein